MQSMPLNKYGQGSFSFSFALLVVTTVFVGFVEFEVVALLSAVAEDVDGTEADGSP